MADSTQLPTSQVIPPKRPCSGKWGFLVGREEQRIDYRKHVIGYVDNLEPEPEPTAAEPCLVLEDFHQLRADLARVRDNLAEQGRYVRSDPDYVKAGIAAAVGDLEGIGRRAAILFRAVEGPSRSPRRGCGGACAGKSQVGLKAVNPEFLYRGTPVSRSIADDEDAQSVATTGPGGAIEDWDAGTPPRTRVAPATRHPGDGPWTMAEDAGPGDKLGLSVGDTLRRHRPGDVFVGASTLAHGLFAGDLVRRDRSTGVIRLDPSFARPKAPARGPAS